MCSFDVFRTHMSIDHCSESMFSLIDIALRIDCMRSFRSIVRPSIRRFYIDPIRDPSRIDLRTFGFVDNFKKNSKARFKLFLNRKL